MLTLFPQLLFLAPFSALLIRLALGASILRVAWSHVATPRTTIKILSLIEAAIAIAIIVGAFTQIAALVAFCVVMVWLAFPSTRRLPRSSIVLLGVLSLSLIATGAGLWAFDLPL